MTLACIGLGSNLGDSQGILKQAVAALRLSERIRIDKCSSCYLSKPWGIENQPDFINALVGIQTELPAGELLDLLQKLEAQFGRKRKEKWGPRTLDLDIISFGNMELSEPDLQLPHPFFAQRDFVLAPLAEIYPDLVISGSRVSDWLARYMEENPHRILPEKIGVSLL